MLLPGEPDTLVLFSDRHIGFVQAAAGVIKLEAIGFWHALLAPDRQ